jgi:hypothetical protein
MFSSSRPVVSGSSLETTPPFREASDERSIVVPALPLSPAGAGAIFLSPTKVSTWNQIHPPVGGLREPPPPPRSPVASGGPIQIPVASGGMCTGRLPGAAIPAGSHGSVSRAPYSRQRPRVAGAAAAKE